MDFNSIHLWCWENYIDIAWCHQASHRYFLQCIKILGNTRCWSTTIIFSAWALRKNSLRVSAKDTSRDRIRIFESKAFYEGHLRLDRTWYVSFFMSFSFLGINFNMIHPRDTHVLFQAFRLFIYALLKYFISEGRLKRILFGFI